MKKFYLVWSPQGHAPTYVHQTKDAAMTEAKRLANLSPDRQFNVMESVGTFEKVSIQYTKHEDYGQPYEDGVPF